MNCKFDSLPDKKYLIGVLIFISLFSIVYIMAISFDEFHFEDKWETVPDYQSKVMSKNPIERFYSRYLGWDGQWYYHIARYGYICNGNPGIHNPYKCNVAFFPLLPLTGRFVSTLFGIPLYYSMQIINQLLLLAIILIFIKYACIDNNKDLLTVILSILLFSLYPGSIYYFTAYSEPMLAFFLVLVFYLTFRSIEGFSLKKFLLIYLCCSLVALVKVTGILVSLVPPIVYLSKRFLSKENISHAKFFVLTPIAGAVALFGFFLYSHLRFGKWNLYFITVKEGWGGGSVNFNPFIIFKTFTLSHSLSVTLSNVILIIIPVILLAIVSFVVKNHKGNYRLLSLFLYMLGIYYFHAILTSSEQSQNVNFMRHMTPYITLLSMAFLNIEWGEYYKLFKIRLSLIVAIQICFFVKMAFFFSLGGWVS